MCTVLLPPGGYPIAVNKNVISVPVFIFVAKWVSATAALRAIWLRLRGGLAVNKQLRTAGKGRSFRLDVGRGSKNSSL